MVTELRKIQSLIGKLDSNYRFLQESKLVINEDQTSKSIDQAKQLYMQRTGKSSEDADNFVRVALRNDLPILRGKEGSKFILGVTRMFLDGELRDERTINNLNKTLKLIASGHREEYNRDLNGESAQSLIQRFSDSIKQLDDKDRETVGNEQYVENNLYNIVPINSFEEASRYSEYTTWCVTHQEEMFDSYTGNGVNQFYFCLRDGYQNVEKVKGENCPLDDYGLSMVAVSVDENGALHTCTCRWNHDNGGNDSIMDTKQISMLIGRNFYEVFKPNHKWEEMLATAKQRLADGFPPFIVFEGNNYGPYDGFTLVKLGNKYNFINKNNEFLTEQWFDDAGVFFNGFAQVELNNMWNYINTNGEYISNKWFDWCRTFINGLANVGLDNKYNIINTKGEYLSEQWFDMCSEFHDNISRVRLNGKFNFINTKGELLSKQWFYWASMFRHGYADVTLDGEDYRIDTNGNLTK